MNTGILTPTLMRWVGLVLIALVELTWLAIRVEVPATGPLSVFKGFPSIFLTSLAVVTILVWARSRGKLRELPIFQNFSHKPWLTVLAHVGAFVFFSWLTILVTEGDEMSSQLAVYWILAWAATGLCTGVFWLLAAMPVRAWLRLFRENASLVLTGGIIIAASSLTAVTPREVSPGRGGTGRKRLFDGRRSKHQ